MEDERSSIFGSSNWNGRDYYEVEGEIYKRTSVSSTRLKLKK